MTVAVVQTMAAAYVGLAMIAFFMIVWEIFKA